MSELSIVPKTEKKFLCYDFTALEIYELSLNLANKTKELSSIKEEKKAISSQYTAKENEARATCNKLSNQVSDGHEIREIECAIDYHKPAQGFKTLTRKDNGQKFEEKMADWEWNLFNQVGEDDFLQEDKPKKKVNA